MEPVTYIALLRACNLVIYRFFFSKMSLKTWSPIGQTMWMRPWCPFLDIFFFLSEVWGCAGFVYGHHCSYSFSIQTKTLFLDPLKSSVRWVFNLNISNKTGHGQDIFFQLDVIRGCLCKLFIMYHIYFYCYAVTSGGSSNYEWSKGGSHVT